MRGLKVRRGADGHVALGDAECGHREQHQETQVRRRVRDELRHRAPHDGTQLHGTLNVKLCIYHLI